MEAFLHRHDELLTQFPDPYPSLEDGEGAKDSKLLIMAWSLCLPTSIQEPTHAESPNRTKDTPGVLII